MKGKELWEILIPKDFSINEMYRVAKYKNWESTIKTMFGQSLMTSDKIWRLEGIDYNTIRLICTCQDIQKVIDFTCDYFQERVLAYRISDKIVEKKRHVRN